MAGREGKLRAVRIAVVAAAFVPLLVPAAPARQSAPAPPALETRVDQVLLGGGGRPWWQRRIDRLIGNRAMGVSVREGGGSVYRHLQRRRQAPASNEKLLLAMALLGRLGPDTRIPTMAGAGQVRPNGVVPGNLWILGRGDPRVGPGNMRQLANAVEDAGITRVRGSVMGSTTFFARDWWAQGWKPYFPAQEIALPTALTWQGNTAGGRHIRDPEERAARSLTQKLQNQGIGVRGPPGSGRPPSGVAPIAEILSPTLASLSQPMLRFSRNFDAEVLGKLLGADRFGAPGTIRKGARAIESFAGNNGARVTAYDSSGLSYSNRVAARAVTKLLQTAELTPWGEDLRKALPSGGQGTLRGRLRNVPVKAKTGTLDEISALSGWVFLRRLDSWAEFSILSRGMPKSEASAIEDKIVRVLWRYAR